MPPTAAIESQLLAMKLRTLMMPFEVTGRTETTGRAGSRTRRRPGGRERRSRARRLALGARVLELVAEIAHRLGQVREDRVLLVHDLDQRLEQLALIHGVRVALVVVVSGQLVSRH